MPSIGKNGISNKNIFEKGVNLLLTNYQQFHLKSKNASTEITDNENKPIIRCFYRENGEMRMDVKINTIYESRYNVLLSIGLVFQKESADPHATNGWVAFFINKENHIKVFKIVLNINEEINL